MEKRDSKNPAEPIDCGNSGTTMRLLAGVLAGQDFDAVLTGDESLCKRPMNRITEPLDLMGAKIETQNGRAPLSFKKVGRLNSINYELPVASAQVKSCLLLAGLYAKSSMMISEPPSKEKIALSRDHTEIMLQHLGADINEIFLETGGEYTHKVTLSGDSNLAGKNLFVPADISSASFFLVAAACIKDSKLKLKEVGLNPTRTAIIDVIRGFGVGIQIENENEANGEAYGDLIVHGTRNFRTADSKPTIGKHLIANLIDEIPVLAVLGSQLPNGLEIRNAAELRVKESDRISAIVKNLKRMGAEVKEFDDGFKVERSDLRAAELQSYGDHRIAMAFAVAGLLADGETTIHDAECARISFPEFFDILTSVVK